jgi:cell division protein FtsB
MSKRLVKKGTSWLLRFFALGLLFLIAFISFALFEETYKKKQVSEEIRKLEEEAKKFEKENSQIKEKIAYLESRDFQEKEARDKLNLQGEGENLVVVKINPQKNKAEEELAKNSEETRNYRQKPNWEKWRDYFFKY